MWRSENAAACVQAHRGFFKYTVCMPSFQYFDTLTNLSDYRKISNISRTKSPNLNDYRFVSQVSLHNPLKPGVKSGMKK